MGHTEHQAVTKIKLGLGKNCLSETFFARYAIIKQILPGTSFKIILCHLISEWGRGSDDLETATRGHCTS